ncbi:hypothetical protein [Saccharicrinis fermentans]|uniref:hypothetical protein n=1 Tax=Saccharicrinis fermentans TaxID=982 RepID=UPI0012B61083|nr:hypothetical protein [Saccharicrinis fermentans]
MVLFIRCESNENIHEDDLILVAGVSRGWAAVYGIRNSYVMAGGAEILPRMPLFYTKHF